MTIPAAAVAPAGPISARYQRLRLWCGIGGIGTVLVSLWVATAAGLPDLAGGLTAGWPGWLAGGVTGGVLGLVVSVVQLPFDAAGERVERAFGQRRPDFPWQARYVRGVGEWLLGLAAAGAVVGQIVATAGGWWWAWAWAGLLALAFTHVAWPLAPARTEEAVPGDAWWAKVEDELDAMRLKSPRVRWFDHGERSLAGGWQGVGPSRLLYLSMSLRQLRPRVAAGLVARELGHLALGHRMVSGVATAGWLTGGLATAAWLRPEAWSSPAAVVVWVSAVTSTWCWVSLLFVWPALGRRQVLAADAFAADRLGAADAADMLDALADHNLPDETLPPAVAFVFHPIPPMQARRDALAARAGGPRRNPRRLT